MNKIVFRIGVIIIFLLTPFVMVAQQTSTDSVVPKAWKLGGKSGLNLTQTGQVNWVQGGVPSVSYLGTVELFAKYNKLNHSWENVAKFAYGQQSQGYKRELRVSDDRIDFESKYGYKVSDKVFITTLGTFKSQFSEGFEYPDDLTRSKVSEFFSPAYLIGAIGADFKPNETTSVFFSPLSVKSTVILDTMVDETKYGLDEGATVRNELGALLKFSNKMKLIENVEMENNLELFSNFLMKPQNIDVLWDLKISMSINKYLKTLLSTTLIYNDDIDIPIDINKPDAGLTKAIQFKEMLSVGFLITF